VVRTTQSRILPDVLREIVQYIPEKSGDKKDEERGLRAIDKTELDLHFDRIGGILKLAQSIERKNLPEKEFAECAYHALYGLRTGRLPLAKKRFEMACKGKSVPAEGNMVGDPEFQGDEETRMAEKFLEIAPAFLAELARRPPKEEGARKGGKANPLMETHRNNLIGILDRTRFPTFRYLQHDRTFPTLLSLVIEDNGPGDEILPDRIWYEQELLRIVYAATPSQPLSLVKDKKGEVKGAQFFGLYELSLSGTRLGQHATRAMAATMLVSRCLTRLSLFKAGTNGDWNSLVNALPMMRVLQTDDISLRNMFKNRPVPQGELPTITLSIKAPLRPWYRKIGYADGRALPSVPASERGTRFGRRQVEVARILATFTARVRRAIAAGVVNAEVAVAAALQDNDIGLTEAESLMMAEDDGTTDVPVQAPAPAPATAPVQTPAPAQAPKDGSVSQLQDIVEDPEWISAIGEYVDPTTIERSESPSYVPRGVDTRLYPSSTVNRGADDDSNPAPRVVDTRLYPSSTVNRRVDDYDDSSPRVYGSPGQAEPLPTPPGQDSVVAEFHDSLDMDLDEPPRMVPSGRKKRQKYTTPPAEYVVPAWAEAAPPPHPPPTSAARAPTPKPASPATPGDEWSLPDTPRDDAKWFKNDGWRQQ
jgi:hypothetical protein